MNKAKEESFGSDFHEQKNIINVAVLKMLVVRLKYIDNNASRLNKCHILANYMKSNSIQTNDHNVSFTLLFPIIVMIPSHIVLQINITYFSFFPVPGNSTSLHMDSDTPQSFFSFLTD